MINYYWDRILAEDYVLRKEYLVRVSRKKQMVIPAEIRRVFGIKDGVVVRVEKSVIKIISVKPMEKFFDTEKKDVQETSREGLLETSQLIY